jgi:hypothetical protein
MRYRVIIRHGLVLYEVMMGDWTIFSNHGHVLVCLAKNKEARLRDVAADVGITERAVQKIVHELQRGGFISIVKHGRCNHYDVNARKNLRHPLQSHCTVGALLQALASSGVPRKKSAVEKILREAPPQVTAGKSEAPKKVDSPGKHEPRPEPEVTRKSEPGGAAGVVPKNRGKPADLPQSGPDAETKVKKKRAKKIDTRQQGSLF